LEASFVDCLNFTREEEGGYVDDPRDSGNWTSGRVGVGTLVGSNMGVGAPALLAWMGSAAEVTAQEMRTLPQSTYEAIARSNYWIPLGCGFLPAGVDLMVFDFGWNRGILTSLDILTSCVGVPGEATVPMDASIYDGGMQSVSPSYLLQEISPQNIRTLQKLLGVTADGIAGPITTRAFQAREDLLVTALILALATAQVASYRDLGNFPIYGAGWLARTSRRSLAALAAAAVHPEVFV